MQYKTFILNSEFRFKRKDNDEDAFRLHVREDGGKNKLFMDRVITPIGFAGTINVDWEVSDVYETPAELGGLGKFVIGGHVIEGDDYFVWTELLTAVGIVGVENTDYVIINAEK